MTKLTGDLAKKYGNHNLWIDVTEDVTEFEASFPKDAEALKKEAASHE